MPTISVVVPTYRRPRLLDECLRSLAAQDIDDESYEVVVVDDGSGDRTPEVMATHASERANVTAITLTANAGPAAARNRAAEAARSELLLFVDDDIVAAPDLLRAHLRLHEGRDPQLGILGRVDWDPRLRVTPFMHWLDRSGLQFGYDTWLSEGPVEPPAAAFYTCNLSLRRSMLLDAGGFDERFPYPAYEDLELAWRLAESGFHLEYHAGAQAYHARPIDVRTFRDRMAKVAESAALLREAQPDFPLDESRFEGPAPTVAERIRLWALARTGSTQARARWYRAEIQTGYARGRRRGTRR